jgi:hypothetical protein
MVGSTGRRGGEWAPREWLMGAALRQEDSEW